MKITKVLPYVVMALLAFFCITNDTVSSAIINFLMAGVIPGTTIQLPWYVVLVLVPLLLFVVWQLIRSIDFVPKDWVAPEKTVRKSTTKAKKSQRGRKNNTHSPKKQQKYNRYTRTTRGRGRKKLSSALTQVEA